MDLTIAQYGLPKAQIAQTQLILIRGLPGSGKSTLAATFQDFTHLETDQYFCRNGQYQFDASQLEAAHRWCFLSCQQLLHAGHKVVVSNTFVRRWEIAPYLKLVAEPMVIHLKSQWQNIHAVEPAVITRMQSRWQALHSVREWTVE